MIIAVLDDDTGERRESLRRVLAADGDRSQVHYFDDSNEGWSPPLSEGTRIDLFLCHWGNKDWLLTTKAMCDVLDVAKVKIAYSGAGVSSRLIQDAERKGTMKVKGWRGISRHLGGINDLSDTEWRQLIEWVRDGADEVALPLMFQDAQFVMVIALDILCQGYLIASESFNTLGSAALARVKETSWWMTGLGIGSLAELPKRLELDGLDSTCIANLTDLCTKTFGVSEVVPERVDDLKTAVGVILGT